MARQFGSVSDFLTIGNDTALTPSGLNMTVIAFVNIPTTLGAGIIIERGLLAGLGGWKLATSSGKVRFSKYGVVDLTSSAAAITTGSWFMVGAVVFSDHVRFCQGLYGGTLAFVDVANSAAFSANVPDSAFMGLEKINGTTVNPFLGSVARVAMWNGQQLTDTQLQQLFAGVSPPTVQASPAGWWELSGSTLNDQGTGGFNATATGTTVVADPVFSATYSYPLSDTGLSVSDTLAVSRRFARASADTGLAVVGDSIAATYRSGLFPRTAADTGLTVTEAVTRKLIAPRSLADTGLFFTESLARVQVSQRSMSVTGLAVTDSLARVPLRGRTLTDTGLVVNAVLVRGTTRLSRSLADGGVAVTDVLGRSFNPFFKPQPPLHRRVGMTIVGEREFSDLFR